MNDRFETASEAGVRYVSDDTPGFCRKRWGRGFTYLDQAGEHIRDPALRGRFEALAIPPAWMEVWICPDPAGHIQATGRDAAGRKQYIYHPAWEEARNQTKFNRLLAFAQALPRLRARVEADLRRHHLPRPKVIALVVRLLDETLIRIGNDFYARQNQTYGLTTLQNHHLEISGATLTFSFSGKGGQQQEIDLRDRRLARLVKRCQELPGQRLFQYVTGSDDPPQPVDSEEVNAYLRESMAADFTAKDFRTWGGTVTATSSLYRQGPGATDSERRQKMGEAVKEVATALGNTPAVCRQYYIHPAVFAAYEKERLPAAMDQAEKQAAEPPRALDVAEKATLIVLEREAKHP